MISMAEVRLSMEEYEALLAASREFEGTGRLPSPAAVKRMKPKRRRKGTPLKGMAAALKKANSMARKKDGSFKKGWSQAKVMKKAHQIRRRG